MLPALGISSYRDETVVPTHVGPRYVIFRFIFLRYHVCIVLV
jgi:hypothetical protein